MDHQNQVCNTFHSSDGIIRRKRSRSRTNPNQVPAEAAYVPVVLGQNTPPGFAVVDENQPQPACSANSNNMSPMTGKIVSGVVETEFEGGYLVSVCVGSSWLSGIIFKSGKYVPVRPENGPAPGVQRIRTNETYLAPAVPRIGTNEMSSPANNETHLAPAVPRVGINKTPSPANSATHLAPTVPRIGTNKMPSPANSGTHLAPTVPQIGTNKMPSPPNNGTHLVPDIRNIRANKMPSPASRGTHLAPAVRRARTNRRRLPATNGTRERHAILPSNGTPVSNLGVQAQSGQLSMMTVQAPPLDRLEGRAALVPVVVQSDKLPSPVIPARRNMTRPPHLAASYVGPAKTMNMAPLSAETHGSGNYFNTILPNDYSFNQNAKSVDLSKPLQTVHPRTGKMTALMQAMERKDFKDPKN